MSNYLDSIYKQAGIGQSRSSVLNPLQWMLVILVGGLALSLGLHAPSWLLVFLPSTWAAPCF
jgi:hypothetical protein